MCERSSTVLRLLSCLVAVAIATSALAGDCPGDLDGSGEVDGGDLAILLGAWGPCDDPDDCAADLDASGDVDGADLAILLGEWGECPDPFDACGQPDAGNCCELGGNGTPGCDDVECCEAVCACDPFCCDVSWDSLCAGSSGNCGAQQLCQCETCDPEVTTCYPCGPGTGDCCVANGTVGCEHEPCCDHICLFDPFCCDTQWDQICADAAILECDVCQ